MMQRTPTHALVYLRHLALGVLMASLLVSFGPNVARAEADDAEKAPRVWAGDQARVAPDFIAVVDFDDHSPAYGTVLRAVPLSGPSAVANEPHHVGLSADKRTLALGGLLSILRNQDQVFFFDVRHPRHPQFIRSDNPSLYASIADEFQALRHGGFLATFMGGPDGAQPGRVIEYDAHQNFVGAWPPNPPDNGFNPHGIAIDEAHNLMVTSDFICPLHTLHVPGGGGVLLRGSVRVWDLAHRSITRTIHVGDTEHPAGTIDIHVGPHHIALDTRFDLDFNRDISTGAARPRGLVTLQAGDN